MTSSKTLGRAFIVACSFLTLNALAASHTGPMKAGDMMKIEMMDTDKDGKVSRAEFLEMMGKIFDMKAKEMGAKDGKLDAGQLDSLRRAMFMQ
jgi:hypothetical protein